MTTMNGAVAGTMKISCGSEGWVVNWIVTAPAKISDFTNVICSDSRSNGIHRCA
jgi:hypothetical protein